MARLTINLLTTASPSDVVNVVPGALVNVFARNTDGSEGAPAAVYESGDPTDSTALAQPLISDSHGRIPGWLNPGDYVIAVSAPGYSTYALAYSVSDTLGIQDPSGGAMPFEPIIQFAGSNVTVVDDPTNTRTVITPTGPAGTPTVRKFPFAFDTPGLLTGAALYTPTIGDVLIDAWIEINTAWNGTTPMGDICTFTDSPGISFGWFASLANAIDMTSAGLDLIVASGLVVSRQVNSLAQMSAMANVENDMKVGVNPALTIKSPPTNNTLTLPGTITTAAPIKVCVSQDGTNTGADPGATQGAGHLYLITATPVWVV